MSYTIERQPPVSYMLIKLATRCNIDCSYCYWFRDQEVYNRPKVLTIEAEEAWLAKLNWHIANYQLKSFSFLFHGGEPLLFGVDRFNSLLRKMERISSQTNCRFNYSLTTNGILISPEWCALFNKFNINVTVSLDGPKHINDGRRVDFKSKGTFDNVLKGIELLSENSISPGILAVCDPFANPIEIVDFFVEELNISSFDILIPDATHDDNPEPVSDFYTALFDYIYSDKFKTKIEVRLFQSIINGLLGKLSNSESIGPGPITTMTLLTDGVMEPLDVMRITENEATKTEIDVFNNQIEDIKKEPKWRKLFYDSSTPCNTCKNCSYYLICGGGHVGSRWKQENGLNNPSVYCEDYKKLIDHIWDKVSNKLLFEQC